MQSLPSIPSSFLQTPSVAVVEMMQCISQALSVAIRKPSSGKPSDMAAAALMQLPHVDAEVLKKLKRRKVNTIKGGYLGEMAGD